MKLLLFIVALLLLPSIGIGSPPVVKTGIEVLKEHNFDVLQGKRVGLITNPTGVDRSLHSTIDILYKAKGVRLVALFGPEHGVRGDFEAGNNVASTIDPSTGIPVYSLYTKTTTKPTASMLANIDVLVYDIQDVGCRSYTYIAVLGLAMEAAASHGIEFVVLDRPNPLGGNRIEGNLPGKDFRSAVCQFPIPYVYGLTCGELATMLNDDGMLEQAVRCSLTVIPMEGWKRSMMFSDTGLEWVPTSPHVPTSTSPAYLVASGILGELSVISVGIGYTIPFRTFAAEWINPDSLAEKMNASGLRGVLFRPITYKPFYGNDKGKTLRGVEVHITNYRAINLMSLQFLFLQTHNILYPGKNPFLLADKGRLRMFDKVMGTETIRNIFTATMSYASIERILSGDIAPFRKRAQQYWLYPADDQ